ncbi:V-type ATP synthase subunit A [Candidatus Woesearchaeota archaeon]|nr:MAG: V-type ATP synthase subunit A [Candidatus Woesearchaeota archaeon]
MPEVIEAWGLVVKAKGLKNSFIGELVYVGKENLIGEIISLNKEIATIQVYEDTTGLKIGDEVKPSGEFLSIELGPGLIGKVLDGLGRPLQEFLKESYFIKKGFTFETLNKERKWRFIPKVKPGDYLKELDIIGEVPETFLITHKIMVPLKMKGRVIEIAREGEYKISETICKIQDEDKIYEVKMYTKWPVRKKRPVLRYLPASEPLITGQRVLDFFFPLAKGGRAIIPGGFGTGKTVLQHQLAKFSDVDIIIYIGCGEIGNEMTQVLKDFPVLKDPKTKRPLLERTILIANTSNMPVTAREASIYTGITIAEYFRDQGYNVALMADSTSRWAEALREISARLEEIPAEEGYPAYLASKLAEFYERAGRCKVTESREGSVTVVGAISPPGGDFSEPVTVYSKQLVNTLWILDKELASQRHFPAISWIQSYSEFIEKLSEWWDAQSEGIKWSELRKKAMRILKEDENLQKIVRLIGTEALPDPQKLLLFSAKLIKEGFLQQLAFEERDNFCSPQKQLELMHTLIYFYERAQKLLKKKIPVSKIIKIPVVNELLRAKIEIADKDLDKFKDLRRAIDTQLSYLEREYE